MEGVMGGLKGASDDRVENDQENFDFSCRYFNTSMAISAVHTWVRTALALVPTNVLIFSVCFSALKNNCRVKDWRGTEVILARFQPLPIRTAREVFPHAAHPLNSFNALSVLATPA